MNTLEKPLTRLPDAKKQKHIGRANCLRYQQSPCRAKICPLEPWKRNARVRTGAVVCYYMLEAAKVSSRRQSGIEPPGEEAKRATQTAHEIMMAQFARGDKFDVS